MRTTIVNVLSLFLLACFSFLGVDEAAAGVPIPCTGESVITVAKTAPTMVLPARNGRSVHVDLGYKFSGCSGGEWVAYPGSGRTFYRLPEQQMRLVLASAGLSVYPSPPSYLLSPSASWSAWLWIAIVGFVVVGTLLAKYAEMAGPRPTAPGGAADLGDWSKQTALEANAPASSAAMRAPQTPQVVVRSRRHEKAAQQPRFGRRA